MASTGSSEASASAERLDAIELTIDFSLYVGTLRFHKECFCNGEGLKATYQHLSLSTPSKSIDPSANIEPYGTARVAVRGKELVITVDSVRFDLRSLSLAIALTSRLPLDDSSYQLRARGASLLDDPRRIHNHHNC